MTFQGFGHGELNLVIKDWIGFLDFLLGTGRLFKGSGFAFLLDLGFCFSKGTGFGFLLVVGFSTGFWIFYFASLKK